MIDQAEADVIAAYGAHYVDGTTTVSETLEGGLKSLYLRRALTSVSSIKEDGSSTALDSSCYRVWVSEGRVERLPVGTLWGWVVIVYVPANDNTRRKSVIVDLMRLYLERTAMKSESIGGEYSYDTGGADAWDIQRAAILRRLKIGL